MKSTRLASILAVIMGAIAIGTASADTATKKEPTAQQQRMTDCNLFSVPAGCCQLAPPALEQR
jgi:hypothetical protein